MAFSLDGSEVKVPREVYSVQDPVSREEAEEFVRWRSRRLRGLRGTDPDLSFEEQVAQYIENPPWRWKTSKSISSRRRSQRVFDYGAFHCRETGYQPFPSLASRSTAV